jgi:hypothetical protein
VNVTPVGSAPVSLRVGAGVPVAVTVNVPAVPTANAALFALVMVGAVVAGVALYATITVDSPADAVVVPVAV